MVDQPHLSSAEHAALAEVLTAERTRTSARIAALSRDFEEIVAGAESANLDDEHDPEGATIGFERAQLTALLNSERAHLGELDVSADRLVRGTFGTCEHCGNRIPVERLTARPTARDCVQCAGSRRR